MPAAIQKGSDTPLIVNEVQGLVTTFSVVFITIMLDAVNYTKKKKQKKKKKQIIGVYFSAYSISLHCEMYHIYYYIIPGLQRNELTIL